VGRYVATISRPDDRLAVLWANAAIYWHADRAPAFRYLWLDPLSQIEGAAAAARATITGDDPPETVVVATSPEKLDPAGQVLVALATRYALVHHVGVIGIYRLRTALPAMAPMP
jgi:hypothetical protein